MSTNDTRDVCSCKCVQHTCTHVVNNVLTYVHYAMSRSNHEEGVMGRWSCSAKISTRHIARIVSKWFILCTDVIEGMRKLDQCGRLMHNFLCDADGVGRLPTFSPEDYNVVSFDERCRKLQCLMRSVQQETTLRAEAWAKLED